MELGISGLASGFDWKALIDQLISVERVPQRRLLTEQSAIQQRSNAYGSVKTQLSVLKNRADALKETSLFDSRSATSSDTTAATVSSSAGTAPGVYSFAFTQLATASKWNGTSNIGAALNATSNVSSLVLSSAGVTNAITSGSITVNGKQVDVATSDTLQQVFDKITAATGGSVTGTYDPATDKISLSSPDPIVLGSATDTSNFLEVAKLYNNGWGDITSASALGGVRTSTPLASANLATPVSDGGAGAGSFKINGVSIAFNASADSLQNVLDRINGSEAGVTASYDSTTDRVVLANKVSGDLGIALEDVTGNFLASTGVASGSLERGKNLLYTLNGGPQITARSNTITADSSGIAGLTVTALKEGSTASVTVASDTAKIKTAITDFIAEYNKAQSTINSLTASTTDAKGKVNAGILATESDASEIASALRAKVNNLVSGLSGAFKRMDDLGIVSNGTDDSISLADADTLENALATNLSAVTSLFTDANDGIATRLSSYLEATAGEEGTLKAKQDRFTSQSAGIDTQLATLERQLTNERERLTNSFVAMETAQATLNQQLQFLQKRFG